MPDTPASLELDEGLFLRHLTLGDAPIVYAEVSRERDDLRAWLPWVDATQSVSDTIRFIENSHEKHVSGEALVYGVWHDLDFCGVIDLHSIDRLNAAAQIGYWLAPRARGFGHITLAAAALLGIAFGILGLERVEIRCAEGNEASARIPIRLGFREEGMLRHAQWLGDRFTDLRLFSLLAADYEGMLKSV
jgi:ribosomal-protein-serine acetyltransferase